MIKKLIISCMIIGSLGVFAQEASAQARALIGLTVVACTAQSAIYTVTDGSGPLAGACLAKAP